MVEQPRPFQPGDEPEDLAVLLADGADHELRGGATLRPRPAFLAGLAIQPAGQLQLRQQVTREVLLPRERANVSVRRALEIDRDARGQAGARPATTRVETGPEVAG